MKNQILMMIMLLLMAHIYASYVNRIKLTDITALTFHSGQYSTGRRVAPVPQLRRVGGNAPYHVQPQTVQCVNRGSDGYGVQWKCETQLPENYKLGKVEVVCEGFDYANDPYVLAGSCGLEYEINHAGNSGGYYNNRYSYNDDGSYFGSIVGVIIFGVITFIILNSCVNAFHRAYNPPYYGEGPNQYYRGSNSGPGFWSGLFTGGILSSLFRPRTYGGAPYRSHSGGSRTTTSTSYGGTRGR